MCDVIYSLSISHTHTHKQTHTHKHTHTHNFCLSKVFGCSLCWRCGSEGSALHRFCSCTLTLQCWSLEIQAKRDEVLPAVAGAQTSTTSAPAFLPRYSQVHHFLLHGGFPGFDIPLLHSKSSAEFIVKENHNKIAHWKIKLSVSPGAIWEIGGGEMHMFSLLSSAPTHWCIQKEEQWVMRRSRIRVELEVGPHGGRHHGLQIPFLQVSKAIAVGFVHRPQDRSHALLVLEAQG